MRIFHRLFLTLFFFQSLCSSQQNVRNDIPREPVERPQAPEKKIDVEVDIINKLQDYHQAIPQLKAFVGKLRKYSSQFSHKQKQLIAKIVNCALDINSEYLIDISDSMLVYEDQLKKSGREIAGQELERFLEAIDQYQQRFIKKAARNRDCSSCRKKSFSTTRAASGPSEKLVHPDLYGELDGSMFERTSVVATCGDFCYSGGFNRAENFVALWQIDQNGETKAIVHPNFTGEFDGNGFNSVNSFDLLIECGDFCYFVPQVGPGGSLGLWQIAQDGTVTPLINPNSYSGFDNSVFTSVGIIECGDACYLYSSNSSNQKVAIWRVDASGNFETLVHPDLSGTASGDGFTNVITEECDQRCLFRSFGPSGLAFWRAGNDGTFTSIIHPSTTDLEGIDDPSVITDVGVFECSENCYIFASQDDFVNGIRNIYFWHIDDYGILTNLVGADDYNQLGRNVFIRDTFFFNLVSCGDGCAFIGVDFNTSQYAFYKINGTSVEKILLDTPLTTVSPTMIGSCNGECLFYERGTPEILKIDQYNTVTSLLSPSDYFGTSFADFSSLPFTLRCSNFCFLGINGPGGLGLWRIDDYGALEPIVHPNISGIMDGEGVSLRFFSVDGQNRPVFECGDYCYFLLLKPDGFSVLQVDQNGNTEVVIDPSFSGEVNSSGVFSFFLNLDSLTSGPIAHDCFGNCYLAGSISGGLALWKLLPEGGVQAVIHPSLGDLLSGEGFIPRTIFGPETTIQRPFFFECQGECFFGLNRTSFPLNKAALYKIDQYGQAEAVIHPDLYGPGNGSDLRSLFGVNVCNDACYFSASGFDGPVLFRIKDGEVRRLDVPGDCFIAGTVVEPCQGKCYYATRSGDSEFPRVALWEIDDEGILHPLVLDQSSLFNFGLSSFFAECNGCCFFTSRNQLSSFPGVGIWRVGDERLTFYDSFCEQEVEESDNNTEEFKEMRLIARLFFNCDPSGQSLSSVSRNRTSRSVYKQAVDRLIKLGDRVSASTFHNLARYIGKYEADRLEAYYYAMLGSFRM